MQKILGIIYFVIKHNLGITVILDLALTWLIRAVDVAHNKKGIPPFLSHRLHPCPNTPSLYGYEISRRWNKDHNRTRLITLLHLSKTHDNVLEDMRMF